ncbi:uncharacterized protein TNCV_810341 [Trichonephila clavipes]|uniref:Uncharacterized protein n=1 Tax=Trichonephila clavipes TaxID=2585209 RepID=A0A8X6SHN1_TRICX|nr:uncharacterized protein TNCV_810341 [Trichonephila clavipes]
MKVFLLNTPDHFRTKLTRPITLNGEWECCLSESTTPGKYFAVQPGYNDFYSIQQLTADSRVRLHVPQNILVTFGERLKDLLGFVQRTFTHDGYKSEYPLELRAGGAAIEEREERRRKEDESEQEGVDKMGERENMLE